MKSGAKQGKIENAENKKAKLWDKSFLSISMSHVVRIVKKWIYPTNGSSCKWGRIHFSLPATSHFFTIELDSEIIIFESKPFFRIYNIHESMMLSLNSSTLVLFPVEIFHKHLRVFSIYHNFIIVLDTDHHSRKCFCSLYITPLRRCKT